MEKTKHIEATLTNEELKEQDAKAKKGKAAEGKKVDKAEIINQISQLPAKERMDLIRDLQNTANKDADAVSIGSEGTTSHYDTLRDGYQIKAKEAEKSDQPEETK